MKNKKNWTDYTLEELEAKKKLFKKILIAFGTIMILCTIFLIYTAISTKNYAFIAISTGSFSFLIPIAIQISMINKEIKSRENNYE